MLNSEITEANDEEEEEDHASHWSVHTEAQKRRIRHIIEHQKSLYCSSSSSLSWTSSAAAGAAASSSRVSFSSSRRRSSLMELMKSGSASLRRLFDMEHISLSNYLDEYSATPVVKTVPLWGSSDSEADKLDPWASFKAARKRSARENRDVSPICGEGGVSDFASHGSFVEADHTGRHRLGEVLLDALGQNDVHPSIQNNNRVVNDARIQDYREKKMKGRVIQEEDKRRRLRRKRSFSRLPGFGLWKWRWRGPFGFRLRLRRFRVLICGRIKL